MTTIDRDEECKRIVRNEVYYCVSSLVADIAAGYGETKGDLGELCEEAFELCTPTVDWEEAAFEEGIEVREGPDGWQYSTQSDRDAAAKWTPDADETEEDRPDPWQDLRHADDESAAWQEACEEENIDPHESEIFEHWIVSPWLAARLEEKNHRVGKLSGMTIWGRPTTGQAIYMDGVIAEIVGDMHRPEAVAA